MNDGLRVTRIADLLTRHPEEKITRAQVCRYTTARYATVTSRTLTRLWPQVEAELGRRGYYVARPIGALDYGVMATTEPLLAMFALREREKNVVTRLRNDERGEVLQRIANRRGHGSVDAALQLERARAYLSAYDNQQFDLSGLYNQAVEVYNARPWATLTDAADMIPWETNGRR